ncbi:MAG: hypothetical protein JST89_09565 [Cyanobacteria bacterium SZAS-4]|nr:hypothetical protein [Cyanobacteria bacterium SZAS-4]
MQKYKPTEGSEEDHDIVDNAHLLDRAEAAEHRRNLKQNPDDLKSRLVLFGRGYYVKASANSEHLIWLIENHPKRWIHSMFSPKKRNDSYEAARTSWLRVVRLNAEDVTVLAHAAEFFQRFEEKAATKMLIKASRLAPSCEELPRQLSFSYRLRHGSNPRETRLLAHNSAVQMKVAIERYALPSTDDSYLLPYFSMEISEVARHVLHQDLLDDAKELARLLLNHKEINRSRNPMLAEGAEGVYRLSTYRGNAILGRVALREGKIAEAEDYLSKMIGVKPDWYTDYELAEELVASGANIVAAKYVEFCRDSWASREGHEAQENTKALDNWLNQILRKASNGIV